MLYLFYNEKRGVVMLKKINARFILFMFVSRTVVTNPELVIQSVKNGMLVCYRN